LAEQTNSVNGKEGDFLLEPPPDSSHLVSAARNSLEGTELTESAYNFQGVTYDYNAELAPLTQSFDSATFMTKRTGSQEARRLGQTAPVLVHSPLDKMQSRSETPDRTLALPQLEPVCSHVEDEVVVMRHEHPRHVQIDKCWPLRESLEQIFVREKETMWINEEMLIDTIVKSRGASILPSPTHAERNQELVFEEDGVDDEVGVDQDLEDEEIGEVLAEESF